VANPTIGSSRESGDRSPQRTLETEVCPTRNKRWPAEDQATPWRHGTCSPGMRDRYFIARRGDDDAGDDRDVEVRVSGGCPVGLGLDEEEITSNRGIRASVEVDPPERGACRRTRSAAQ